MAIGNGSSEVQDAEVLRALTEIAEGAGAPAAPEDLLTFGGALPFEGAESPDDEEGTYESQPQPGSSEAEEVDLDTEERAALARELAEKLQHHDSAMRGPWERWAEIEDAYALLPEGGSYRTTDGERMVSPLLMTMVDQAEARLEGGILEAEPLVRIRPISGIGQSQIALEEDAGAAERFYNNYLKTAVRIGRRLVPALRRTPKLGTAVLRWDWKDEKRTYRHYTRGGTLQETTRRDSRLDFSLIDNEQVVVWPLDIVDWQDAEMVGHRAYYSKAGWARKSRELGLSKEDSDRIANAQISPQVADARQERMERHGADRTSWEANEPPVCITELWCNMMLPGYEEPERFVAIFHEGTPELLRITWNTHHSQRHPYFPLRWKILDGWAWGSGIGHELVYNQAIASALKTLDLDNLAAGAYWVNQIRMGSLAHQITDRVRPGETIPVEEIDKDFKPTKMGGAAPEVGAAAAANDYEGRTVVGIPDVLQGQGDARLKSGASTGQTLALIEQASVKLNSTGRTVKDDGGDFFRGGFEHLCQYAPDGLITRYTDEDDELVVRSLRWTPPRGTSIAEAFELWIEAPSMSTSNESRKERGLILTSFLGQQMQLLQPLALQLLETENPAAIGRYLRQIYSFFEDLTRRIVRYHDLPGVEQRFPSLPEEMPADQILNQLQQQLGELSGQVESLTQENQQLLMNIQQGLHHEQPQGMPS